MAGVEILSSEIVYETEISLWPIAVCAGVAFLISLIACIISWCDFGFDWEHIPLIIACIFIGGFVGAFGCLMTVHETDTVDYIKYKVTISDGVNFTEFMDKYEILDQEGKIYTITEKEN